MKKIFALMILGLMMGACGSSDSEVDELELDEVASDSDMVEQDPIMEEEMEETDGDLSEIGSLEGMDGEENLLEESAAEANNFVDNAVDDGMQTMDSTSNSFAGSDSSYGNAGMVDYTVQRGDTLMKIAYKMTGDVSRWKEIYNSNQAKIPNPNLIPVGVTLQVPSNGFVDSRQGNPYVIRRGDTLGKISKVIYGTIGRWKEIYNNNNTLVKDPNRIYAGFKLFYQGAPLAQGQLDRASAAVGDGQEMVDQAQEMVETTPPPPPAEEELQEEELLEEEELPMDGVVNPE